MRRSAASLACRVCANAARAMSTADTTSEKMTVLVISAGPTRNSVSGKMLLGPRSCLHQAAEQQRAGQQEASQRGQAHPNTTLTQQRKCRPNQEHAPEAAQHEDACQARMRAYGPDGEPQRTEVDNPYPTANGERRDPDHALELPPDV